jgi:hypothetical protein
MDLVAGQVVWQVGVHKRRTICVALATLTPGGCLA